MDSDNKAVIIKAGPGTGKTRTLTAKIAHLVHEKGIDPDAILALTFTNKAARELEQRIEKYLPGSGQSTLAPGLLAATFHSFSLKLLQKYQGFNATIVDEEVRLQLLEKVIDKTARDNGIDTGKHSKRQIKNIDLLISMARQQLLSPENDLASLVADHNLDTGLSPLQLQQVYHEYEKSCEMMNIADFEGLIFRTVQLLRNDPKILSQVRHQYVYLFVDEYQDLNLGQYELVKLMARDQHIFVIGDPDQSIYGFRGSDNKYFHRFETDFKGCDHITLTQNYRSTQKILDASFQVIEKSETAGDTAKVYSDIDSQKKLVIQENATEKAEASAIARMIVKLVGGTSFFSMDSGLIDGDDQETYAFSDIAVLCRTRHQLQHFISAFEKEGIPVQTADKKGLYELDGIRQLMDAARLVCHTNGSNGHAAAAEYSNLQSKLKQQVKLDDQEISRLSASFNGCDGAKSLRIICEKTGLDTFIAENETAKNGFELLVSMAAHYDDLKEFLEAQSLNQDADILAYDTQKVSLLTMHAAKGLEFCTVFVVGCEQGLIPFSRHNEDADDIEPNDIEEERRLFYVAMTRAKERLWLSYAKKRLIFGKMEKRQRSIFIDDIEAQLLKTIESRVYHRPVPKPRQLELF